MSDVTRSSIPDLVPVELLRECFDYDRETGSLTWRQRPLEHFCDPRTAKMWNTKYAGKSAGRTNSLGYRQVGLTVDGRLFQLYRYRIAWAIMTGAWPETQINHEDDNRDDDRWAKLRPTDSSLRIHATAALTGKGVVRRRKYWRACIKADGKRVHLGCFPTYEAAHAAYLEAKKRLLKATTVQRHIREAVTSGPYSEEVKALWSAVERLKSPLTYEVEKGIIDLAKAVAKSKAELAQRQ